MTPAVDAGLAAWRACFGRLAPPAEADWHGVFRVEFIGPAWLRRSAPAAIALGGLPRWHGKQLLSADEAVNLVRTREGLAPRLPMRVSGEVSSLDGARVRALRYDRSAPWPWPRVRDELRAIDGDTWLGMTIIDLPRLRGIGWPFLLRRA